MLSFRTRGNFVDFVHTDNTSLEVESVIMSLHNTSKAVDWSLPEDTTRINFTIDDISYDNILITDIDFDGVTMTAQADFKTNIETIFPGLAGGGGALGYLVYTALLVQTGSDIQVPPVATIFQNTIGDIVWSFDGSGACRGILAGAFPVNKRFVIISTNTFTAAADFLDANTVYYTNYDNTWTGLDGCSAFIEIRVYP